MEHHPHKIPEGGMYMQKRNGWLLAYILTIAGALISVHWGNRAVTVIAENMPIPRANCIVIDPGHGGVDGGATSCTGRLEKEYNLEIACRLEDTLKLLGYRTEMTRRTDESIHTEGETIAQKKLSDLKERVRIVNESQHSILISIHQNLFPESRYRGAQVFYGKAYGSLDLAAHLQSKIIQHLNPGSHRKAKECTGVYLMDRIQCPGILVECGFISNPAEEKLLSDPEYQKKLCCIIASSLDHFLAQT